MKTSLIIPSYNPALKLPLTLDLLIVQRELIDELIVVADKKNYTEEINSILNKYSNIFNLRIILQDISGRGISRNKGAEVSSGDLLVFLDDDMLAENNLIEKHIQYHLDNPWIIVSGNGYRNPENVKYDFGKFLINTEKSWKGSRSAKYEVTFENFNFTASNMSLPKKIFHKLDGFDTRFSDGEDFDFAVRGIKENIKIMYDSTLIAWHNDWPEIDSFIKRQNEYTTTKMEIIKIHPDYIKYFPDLKIIEGSRFKKNVSSFIRMSLGKWTVSENYFFKILPLRIKFLLYRLTIASCSIINK